MSILEINKQFEEEVIKINLTLKTVSINSVLYENTIKALELCIGQRLLTNIFQLESLMELSDYGVRRYLLRQYLIDIKRSENGVVNLERLLLRDLRNFNERCGL